MSQWKKKSRKQSNLATKISNKTKKNLRRSLTKRVKDLYEENDILPSEGRTVESRDRKGRREGRKGEVG